MPRIKVNKTFKGVQAGAERQAARQAERKSIRQRQRQQAGRRIGPSGLQYERDRSTGFTGPSGAALAAQSVSRPQPQTQDASTVIPQAPPPGAAAPASPLQPESSFQSPVAPLPQPLSAAPAAQSLLGEAPQTEPVRPSVGENVLSQTPRLEAEGFPLLGGGQVAESAAESAPSSLLSSPAPFAQTPSGVIPFAGTGRTKGMNVSSVPGLTGGGIGLPGGGGGGSDPSALLRLLQTLIGGPRA